MVQRTARGPTTTKQRCRRRSGLRGGSRRRSSKRGKRTIAQLGAVAPQRKGKKRRGRKRGVIRDGVERAASGCGLILKLLRRRGG